MATSELNIMVDRSGFSMLQGSHTGLTNNFAETFTFPAGTWSVQAISMQVTGNSNRNVWIFAPNSSSTEAIYQTGALWHQDNASQPISLYPMTSKSYFYNTVSSLYVQSYTFGTNNIAIQPSDKLYFEGLDATTVSSGATCFISVTALRLV